MNSERYSRATKSGFLSQSTKKQIRFPSLNLAASDVELLNDTPLVQTLTFNASTRCEHICAKRMKNVLL
jgi:hypothetical protein